MIPQVSPTLRAGGNKTGGDRPPGTDVDTCESLIPVQAVAHTLRADGFDASEDGTGRGTPLVPVVAFGCKDSDPARSISEDISPTLRAMGHADSHANAGGQLAVAFAQNQRDEVRQMEVAGALAAEPGMKQQTYLQSGMQVRRLTPRECERLQGAPDDWTLVPKLGNPRKQRKNEPDAHYAEYLKRHSGGVDLGPMMADGPRYKMLGNSFAVPVIRWIGEQIGRAHHIELKEAA